MIWCYMIHYQIVFLQILTLSAAYRTIGNVKIEPLPNLNYRSLLTGTTYDLKEISNLDGRTIKKRSLDLACVHLDVHCTPDDDNVIDVFFTEQGSVIESPEPTACTFGTFGVIDLAHFLRCDWLTQEMPCYAVSERLLYT